MIQERIKGIQNITKIFTYCEENFKMINSLNSIKLLFIGTLFFLNKNFSWTLKFINTIVKTVIV
jgi:hypothetical protein